MSKHRSIRSIFLFFISLVLLGTLGLFSGACGSVKEETEATQTESVSSTPVVESTSTSIPTYTPSAPRVILLISQETDPELLSSLQPVIEELATEAGYVLEIRTTLTADEIDPSVQLVVGLPPDQGLGVISETSLQVQFLGIGLPGLSPTDNLSVVGPTGFTSDHVGFLAGYLAAVITTDWRVGVIGRSDTSTGLAEMNGFMNGASYFCGTCRPVYPPYVQYPIQVGLSQSEIENRWQSAVDVLTQASVRTVFLSSEIDNLQLLSALVESGMVLIGGNSPADELRAHWVATVHLDPGRAVRDMWDDLLKGQGGASLPVPILVTEVNPDLFSSGKQRLVETILRELMEGFIDTGVDPRTGEMD